MANSKTRAQCPQAFSGLTCYLLLVDVAQDSSKQGPGCYYNTRAWYLQSTSVNSHIPTLYLLITFSGQGTEDRLQLVAPDGKRVVCVPRGLSLLFLFSTSSLSTSCLERNYSSLSNFQSPKNDSMVVRCSLWHGNTLQRKQ